MPERRYESFEQIRGKVEEYPGDDIAIRVALELVYESIESIRNRLGQYEGGTKEFAELNRSLNDLEKSAAKISRLLKEAKQGD